MITYSRGREYRYRNRREKSCQEISAFASGSARFVGSWNWSLCSLSGETFSGIHFIYSPCGASVYRRRRNLPAVCSLSSVSWLQKSGKNVVAVQLFIIFRLSAAVIDFTKAFFLLERPFYFFHNLLMFFVLMNCLIAYLTARWLRRMDLKWIEI